MALLKKVFSHAYLPVLFCWLVCSQSEAQNRVMDSLSLALSKANHDTARVMIYGNLFWENVQAGNYEKANTYAEKTIELANTSGQLTEKWKSHALASAYNELGVTCDYTGKYDEAINYYMKALKLKENTEDRKSVAAFYSNIGTVYSEKGDYEKALGYFLKALKIHEEFNNKRGIADSYITIGVIYDYKLQFDIALDYYQKALKVYDQICDGRDPAMVSLCGDRKAMCYNNIALVYENKPDLNKALFYHKKAKEVFEQFGDLRGISVSLMNMGGLYVKRGDSARQAGNKALAEVNYKPALESFHKAMEIKKQLGDQKGTATVLNNIGIVMLHLGKPEEARKYGLESLEIAKKIGVKSDMKNAYEFLAGCDSVLALQPGMPLAKQVQYWKSALSYHILYGVVKDSLFNIESNARMSEMQSKYNYEKKEAAVKLEQEKKDAIAAGERHRQKIIMGSITAILVVLLVFSGLLFNRFRIIRKQNRIIEHQKAIVEEKQKEILDSIHYAKRIQNALFTSERYIERNLNRHKEKSNG